MSFVAAKTCPQLPPHVCDWIPLKCNHPLFIMAPIEVKF